MTYKDELLEEKENLERAVERGFQQARKYFSANDFKAFHQILDEVSENNGRLNAIDRELRTIETN